MKNNILDNVGEMIETSIGKSKNLKEGILKAEWEKIVGRLVEKSQPEYIKDGVLTVTVEGPVFIHYFNGNKQEYIEKINEYFKTELITDIDIRSGKLDENRFEYLERELQEDENSDNSNLDNVDKKEEDDDEVDFDIEFDDEKYKEDEFDRQFEDEQREIDEEIEKEVIGSIKKEVEKKPEKKRKKEVVAYDMSNAGILRKIQQLEKMANAREKYLLENGYTKCKGCGVIFKATEDEKFCRVCLTAKKDRG